MAARSVAPTKTNLLALRQELVLARQGHELLDQKRNILVIELLSLVDQASDFEAKVNRALESAHRSLIQINDSQGLIRYGHALFELGELPFELLPEFRNLALGEMAQDPSPSPCGVCPSAPAAMGVGGGSSWM